MVHIKRLLYETKDSELLWSLVAGFFVALICVIYICDCQSKINECVANLICGIKHIPTIIDLSDNS